MPEQRIATLQKSLANRSVYDLARLNFTSAYEDIFTKYTFAHTSALQKCESAAVTSPFSTTSPYASFYENDQLIPRDFKIICIPSAQDLLDHKDDGKGSVAPVATTMAAPEVTIRAHFMVLVAHSQFFAGIARGNMLDKTDRTITAKDVHPITANTLVKWMYDSSPIQIASDKHAYDLHRLASQWMVDPIADQTRSRFNRYQLQHFCHPDQIVSPEAFEKNLADTADVEIVRVFQDATQVVMNLTQEFLDPILSPAPVEPAPLPVASAAAPATVSSSQFAPSADVLPLDADE